MKNLSILKIRIMLCTLVIAKLVLSFQSYSQGITLVQKGFTVKYDSTVLIDIGTYREIRNKSLYADTLITGLREQVNELNIQVEYYHVKEEALKGSNQILISQNKELRESNSDLLEKYGEAVKKKWFESPLLYGVSGLVLGILITR